MTYMFSGSRATTLDLGSFDTSNVTNMSSMFSGSEETTLDLSSFDTSNVVHFELSFSNIYAKTIYVSSLNEKYRILHCFSMAPSNIEIILIE